MAKTLDKWLEYWTFKNPVGRKVLRLEGRKSNNFDKNFKKELKISANLIDQICNFLVSNLNIFHPMWLHRWFVQNLVSFWTLCHAYFIFECFNFLKLNFTPKSSKQNLTLHYRVRHFSGKMQILCVVAISSFFHSSDNLDMLFGAKMRHTRICLKYQKPIPKFCVCIIIYLYFFCR